MGASKNSRVLKRMKAKKQNSRITDARKMTEKNATGNTTVANGEATPKNGPELIEKTSLTGSEVSDSSEPAQKKIKKSRKKKEKSGKKGPSSQALLLTDKMISNLSRALGANDWIKLAYALGFLPQGIANFVGRASSAQNSYSQCTFMLKTWRELTDLDEILPRLCDALQRIRRHDLSVKLGLELAVPPKNDPNDDSKVFSKLIKMIEENKDSLPPPYEESKIIFNDDKVSFLARQLLAREEWKWFSYALGFLPDDASHIIATASSSQNLYAQAHKMLTMWRNKTPPDKISGKLRAAFTRIRRHDLVFLLDLGEIVSFDEERAIESLDERLQKLEEESKRLNPGLGSQIIAKFKELNT
ncbi:uncharacterized protein LOC143470213 [Clavelina lepadiformis]|uniref:Death domain-containing protein n=1 Tax=Clavelina lepadiformis TaxID=159417 RepID=A0ABP0FYW6_CLALP